MTRRWRLSLVPKEIDVPDWLISDEQLDDMFNRDDAPARWVELVMEDPVAVLEAFSGDDASGLLSGFVRDCIHVRRAEVPGQVAMEVAP